MAIFFDDVFGLFKFMLMFNAIVAAAFWLGMLKVESVTRQWLGFDLSHNIYALNETYTVLSRIFIPFAILILASFVTRPEDELRLARFYGKMRTPVQRALMTNK